MTKVNPHLVVYPTHHKILAFALSDTFSLDTHIFADHIGKATERLTLHNSVLRVHTSFPIEFYLQSLLNLDTVALKKLHKSGHGHVSLTQTEPFFEMEPRQTIALAFRAYIDFISMAIMFVRKE